LQLLDSTLREGEQTPGVSFSVEEKVKIAKLLDQFGIDIIEVGHPAVSEDVKRACRVLAEENMEAETLAHARAMREDIDLVLQVGTPWVGIWLGTSPLSLEHKFHIGREEALGRIRDSISYAKERGLKVRFTPEDATRTEFDYLAEVMELAERAGADRISLADTVGTALPGQMKELVEKARGVIDLPLHVHCHNDYGMAVANALAGYEGGAHLIDVTINGLGERTGITALAPLAVALNRLYEVEKGWRLELLPRLARKVEEFSGLFNAEGSPIVGEHAFAHKAGLHTGAVLEEPRTYEAIPPEVVNQSREIVIDKYTGKAAVKNRLAEMGVEVDGEKLGEIVGKIKEKASKGKSRFTDVDVLEIADDVLELDLRSRTPKRIEALVSFSLNSTSYTTRATRKIVALDEVDQVYEVTGDNDIMAHLEVKSIGSLNEIIEDFRNMEEVERTSTSLILKDYVQQD